MTTAHPAAPSTGEVIIVGSVSADLTTFSERRPAPGETILGTDFSLVLGGKGANQAIAAARAGATSRIVSCVGSDTFADLVRDGLDRAGVDLADLRTTDGQTGIAHIRVDASGENDIVVVPQANSEVSAEQIDEALADLPSAGGVLLTQGEIPRPAMIHAIRRGQERGLMVVLDPAPAPELEDEIWALVDIVTPNETEATLLTGITVDSPESAARAGHWFLDRGVRAAVITMAGAGSLVVTAEGETTSAQFPVEVVDTTAAGDAYAGYLAAGLAAGLDLTAAIRRASAAGALAVTRRGASPSIPAGSEVDALLAERA